MAISPAEFANFEALVRTDDGLRERQTGAYLQYAYDLLVSETIVNTRTIKEHRSDAGDADLIVVADVHNDLNMPERVAYIWELKAPQCYLFEKDDTPKRCRPTKDFLKAENQLLHYVYKAQNDDAFREDIGVMHGSNIRAGGIIIGTDDRLIKNPTEDWTRDHAFRALRIRTDYFYSRLKIRILNWDRILEAVRPIAPIE